MAARSLKPRHQDEIREKIKGTQLLNYLQNHAIEGTNSKNASTRVRAAIALLDKCVPNLSAMELSGEVTSNVARMPTVAVSADEWREQWAQRRSA